MRVTLIVALAAVAALLAPPAASAQVRDCDFNLVRAKPVGTYLTVTSVRDMSCRQARRVARRARLRFDPPSMRLRGWECVQTGTAGAGTQDPVPLYRCVRGGRAFRATARP